MAKDFLLEIGTEEIPARFIEPALKQLKELAEKHFTEQRLSFQQIKTYATPRRLVLHVTSMDEQQQSLTKEVKGPAKKAAFDGEGQPTKAILGFTRGQGVSLEQLEVRLVGKVEYMYAVVQEEGRPAVRVLSEIAPQIINELHFPKPMRWANLDYRFARPIRWILALFGTDVVPFTIADLASNRYTYGHRFLSREVVKINEVAAYFPELEKNYVLVDGDERRRIIWEQVQSLAANVGGHVQPDEDLLQEISNIVEYPTALMGSFKEDYLKLPNEVIITPMREHQRYFPVLDSDGNLLPKFITVRNGTEQHLDIVTAGNERVLTARLADAEFFFVEDLKTPLTEKVAGLTKVVWLEGLGTVYEKVQRIDKLAKLLADELDTNTEQREITARAAQLAKADLVTNMVYEFPELQGVMGKEYARRNGEPAGVAEAIFEHYLPRYAGDQLPTTLPGQLLSIADKMDSIVGCFAVGIQPTGSQDPYALRRQALAIAHIIFEAGLPLSLGEMIKNAYTGYQNNVELKLGLQEVSKEIMDFFKQRIKGIFTEAGLSYDTIDAVLEAGFDNLADAWQRGQQLTEFRKQPAFNDLLTAFNRVNNLAKKSTNADIKAELLQEPAEKSLYQAYTVFEVELEKHLAHKDYAAGLNEIAHLLPSINNFFTEIMVMAEDESLRNNRLALLTNLAKRMKIIADFSKIVA